MRNIQALDAEAKRFYLPAELLLFQLFQILPGRCNGWIQCQGLFKHGNRHLNVPLFPVIGAKARKIYSRMGI